MNPFKKYNRIGGWLCFAIATLCYLLTMEPTASLWDCAEFIATSYKLEVGHPPGAPLFMMIARFFTIFAGAPDRAALMVNTMSSLASGFTILFLFWSITMLALKWFGKKAAELSRGETWAVIGAGAVGALAYAFTDTFWFSGVEGEVYALSSFFTAIVFWAMLRWEQLADEPHAGRWLILIAYLIGLSIGVHQLNLLAFPAMIFIYYFKKYPKTTPAGVLAATGISVAAIVFVLYIVCPWTVKLGAWTDLLFVNSFGLPVNSGMATYAFVLFALLAWGVWHTYKKRKAVWNTFLLMTAVIMLGYSSYASVIIRSTANPPMNSNNPSNPFGLTTLLSRDQYGGGKPLLSGQTYASPFLKYKFKTNYYIGEDGRYVPYTTHDKPVFAPEFDMLFSRMHDSGSEAGYREWVGELTGRQVMYNGEVLTVPTFGENLRFFFRYQLNFMYWRYFMWNFVGRQNDEQADGGPLKGNALSGIDFIDRLFLGPQENLPDEMANNKGRNRYYCLPLILGILGLLSQLKRDKRGFTVVMWLFFMTGIAIVIYLNQTPGEVRERDYAYAGSFYAFAIWIGIGALWVYEKLSQKIKDPRLAAGVATALCLSVPAILCAQNWDDHDRSHRYIARDIGYDYLETVLPNAIIMNFGDNDTFPLWYNQEVENVRPDVRIMNLSYLGGEWYVDQMKIRVNDSDPVPFSIPQAQYYRSAQTYVDNVRGGVAEPIRDVMAWLKSEDPRTKVSSYDGRQFDLIPAKTIQLPVNRENAVAAGIIRPEEVEMALDTITFTISGDALMRTDVMLLDLLANFDWKRPLYFTQPQTLQSLGLMEYLQQDGLAYRLVPFKTPYSFSHAGRIDTEILYENLMEKFRYGNLKDPRVYPDYYTRYTVAATQLRGTAARLADQLVLAGDSVRAEAVLDRIVEELPFSQVPHNSPFSGYLIEAYYHAGNPEKANALLEEYAASLKQHINYYISFPPGMQESILRPLEENLYYLSHLASLAEEHGQTGPVEEIDAFLRFIQESI